MDTATGGAGGSEAAEGKARVASPDSAEDGDGAAALPCEDESEPWVVSTGMANTP